MNDNSLWREFLHFQFFDIFGILGAGIVLILFILVKFNIIELKSKIYNWGNFIGSCFLIYFAWKTRSLPFIVLNTVWASVSLYSLYSFNNKKRK